ncbi:hypothetical protein WICMUC_005842 [Wickerhamomyces mucosus]|uniref:Uncharacterized protein n=1 Tax=Wickerhamomyces mucosus TaxID=1378264 RepID=A0A9P8P3E3_9ASCO|nr:hypothetical protein WICMUC_005842 [Wickerhamomyces mucosus]
MSYHGLPSEPPSYEMDFEETIPSSREPFLERAQRFTRRKIITPVRDLLDPIAEGYSHLSRLSELYLAKLGNPLILKRVFYVIFISIIMFFISKTGVITGDLPTQEGSFSNIDLLMKFINENIDLKSLEENLEYLSSIDHISGTIGDLTLARYIESLLKDSFKLDSVIFAEDKTLLNYPERITLNYDDIELDLTKQYNPLSKNEEIDSVNLIYLNYGQELDYQKLIDNSINFENSIAIIKNGKIPISQKLIIAETFGIKGILFISNYEEYPESFEKISAAIPNFYPGNPLIPDWSPQNSNKNKLSMKDSSISKIPSVSLSRIQALPLLNKLNSGYKFDDGYYSGDSSLNENSSIISLNNNVTFVEDHPIWNVWGKIEGREQADQAIIIGAQRDSLNSGTITANSGTVVLLQIVELFNKLKETYQWQPLRSIYFISFDATEYNFAGADLETKKGEFKDVIAYIDLNDIISGDELQIKSSGLLESKFKEFSEFENIQFKNFDEYRNYIPFMRYGVPIVDIGFKGSNYPKLTNDDNFENFQNLKIDSNYLKFQTIIKIISKIILSISDDPLIPFDITRFVNKIDEDFRDLQNYINFKKPDSQFNFDPIIKSLLKFKQFGTDYDEWKNAWSSIVNNNEGIEPSLFSIHRWNWNARLALISKVFINPDGISQTRWNYKNIITGPQFFKPEEGDFNWFSFPSIRDVVDEDGNIQQEINKVGEIIRKGVEIFKE